MIANGVATKGLQQLARMVEQDFVATQRLAQTGRRLVPDPACQPALHAIQAQQFLFRRQVRGVGQIIGRYGETVKGHHLTPRPRRYQQRTPWHRLVGRGMGVKRGGQDGHDGLQVADAQEMYKLDMVFFHPAFPASSPRRALIASGLSHCAALVHRYDRERFVTALFAPPARREALMVLYAFNVEVARIRESVHEPLAGAIRRQWWREVITGERPEDEILRHPIARPLRQLLGEGTVAQAPLVVLLDGREEDFSAEPYPDMESLEAYVAATSASLSEAAFSMLGGHGESGLATARAVGTGYGLVGLLRAMPFHGAMGRFTVPVDCLERAAIPVASYLNGRAPRDRLAMAVKEIAMRAEAHLAQARTTRPQPETRAVTLAATLASGHLRRLKRCRWDVFDPVIARPATRPVMLGINALLNRF